MRSWSAEVFIEAGNTLGEGPIWWRKRNLLVWVDILECKVFAANGSGSIVDTFEMPEPVGCVFEMLDGSLLAGCQTGLRTVPDGILIAKIPNASPDVRINDGKVDPWGNLVFGTMGFPEPRKGEGALWRWDGKTFSELLDGVTIPNGMVWRQEQSEFLFIDTPSKCIKTYQYGASTNRLGEPVSVVDLAGFDGDPDGMCEGPNGDLYVAMWDGASVVEIRANGEITPFPIPTARPTSLLYDAPLNFFIVTSASANDVLDRAGGSLFKVSLGSPNE